MFIDAIAWNQRVDKAVKLGVLVWECKSSLCALLLASHTGPVSINLVLVESELTAVRF